MDWETPSVDTGAGTLRTLFTRVFYPSDPVVRHSGVISNEGKTLTVTVSKHEETGTKIFGPQPLISCRNLLAYSNMPDDAFHNSASYDANVPITGSNMIIPIE
jgi:hypothetical protein